jgi:hypothetical protein
MAVSSSRRTVDIANISANNMINAQKEYEITHFGCRENKSKVISVLN